MKKIKLLLSIGLLIACCLNVFGEEKSTIEVKIEPRRGPIYQYLPYGNFCELGGYTVEYGSFETSAPLDFSKTRTELTEYPDSHPAYLYHYYDANGKEYIPYFDGFVYQESKTYKSSTCSSKVYR